jgi:hypothetical protein
MASSKNMPNLTDFLQFVKFVSKTSQRRQALFIRQAQQAESNHSTSVRSGIRAPGWNF